MSILDWILNLAGVFLWIDWRSGTGHKPHSILSLASTLRAAGSRPGKGLGSLVMLLLILAVRPFFYYTVGSGLAWTPTIEVLGIVIPWRSDLLARMLFFSTLSFCIALGYYYAWMLLLAAINDKIPDTEVMQRFVRAQLGWLDKIPWWFKLLLPSMVAGLAWLGIAEGLIELELLPRPARPEAIWGQAGAIALAALLSWKWLLVTLFLLHFLNIYVYLGTHPVWTYISLTSRKVLRPLSFLRFGKLDLAPLAGVAAVLLISEFLVKRYASWLFQQFVL